MANKVNEEVKKDALTDQQVIYIYNHLDKADTHSNKELLESDDLDIDDIPDQTTDDALVKGVADEFTEKQMKELGLDDETIESLKDVEIDESSIKDVKPSSEDYLEAIANYVDISTEDSEQLLNILIDFDKDPNGKYYDRLPTKIKSFCDGIRMNAPEKMSKNSSATFILTQFTHDAQFGKLMDDYTNDMANLTNEMHKEFRSIIQESFDDLFENIEKIKDNNPEHAEILQRFYDAFKGATTFQKQLDYLDGAVNKKKLNKWLDRFDNECFYFNKKVNSDVNKERGMKFADIRTLIPIVKTALNGFTEKQIKLFFLVFLKSVEKMDLDSVENLFYIYGVVSGIDSFRYNKADEFDTEFGKTLFGNITKVIQKIISLD